MKQLGIAVLRDCGSCWKPLLLTDVLYKLIGFMLLTPLTSVLLAFLLELSGKTVLADQDILFFFLAPTGWFCAVVIGSILLAIKALELAALMAILSAERPAEVRPINALWFAYSKAVPVLQVTSRVVGMGLLVVAPFLVMAGAAYYLLLSAHDINFYLKEKPPEFQVALGIGGLILAAIAFLLIRFITNWFFALPVMLFEDIPPRLALSTSRERSIGNRRKIIMGIMAWLVATGMVFALSTGAVLLIGRLFVVRMAGSLATLATAVGICLLIWWLVNLIINSVSTTTFAALLLQLYRSIGSSGKSDRPRLFLATSGAESNWIQLTRSRLLAGMLVGIVVALAVGILFLQSLRLEDHTQIMAHRGASASAPENTMASVRQAIADGADWVEIDVQETADGEVVVFHDSDFMKLANNPLKIWDAKLTDLQDIDIGSWFDPAFSKERVPTLSDVLKECKGQIGVNIELKYYGHDQRLEQRVVRIVEAHGMVNQIVIMSLKLPAVEKMRSLRSEWNIGLLMSVAAGDLKKINADFLAVNAAFVDHSFIRAAHSIDKQVYVWTVNDAVGMSKMIGMGADALITDEPALARSVLEQRAQLSAPERLMVELSEIFGIEPEAAPQ